MTVMLWGLSKLLSKKRKKDCVIAMNNPQKISPTFYLSVDEYEVVGKPVLYIFVPESSQVHRCNGKIFDRNEDRGLDISSWKR